MSNKDNPHVGATFQSKVAEYFRKTYQKEFELEKKIAIGNPGKDHKFDIVAYDGSVVIECKCYTWTETGNIPSAKMGFCNEAAFYLSFLSDTVEKYIVMLESRHPKHDESLANYYYRINRHLLGTIKVAEYNPSTDKFWIIG